MNLKHGDTCHAGHRVYIWTRETFHTAGHWSHWASLSGLKEAAETARKIADSGYGLTYHGERELETLQLH